MSKNIKRHNILFESAYERVKEIITDTDIGLWVPVAIIPNEWIPWFEERDICVLKHKWAQDGKIEYRLSNKKGEKE